MDHHSFVIAKQQAVDIFTKGLSNAIYEFIVCKLGIHNIYAPA